MKTTLKPRISSFRRTVRRLKRLLLPSRTAFLRHCHGVIHVGAHHGQERQLYRNHQLRVIWVEGSPETFAVLQTNLAKFPEQQAVLGLAVDSDRKELDFHISSNEGGSSSVLAPAQHRELYPDVDFIAPVKAVGHTLPTLLHGIDLTGMDCLVLDTQGSELMVLRGAESLLPQFQFIKSEAADFESYQGCATVKTLDEFLTARGFRLRHKWLNARGEVGRYYDILWERRT